MKVTVCFGSTRVVVPCGDGDIQVRDLILKAIPRYKKATGKPSDSWVTVHNLRQLDGGILDPDDQLLDVADDREQIIAIYDEATQPQQGDGTSASDDSENPSPDIFKNTDHKFEPFSRNGIDITGDELNGTPPLHVRRGSEPALNRLSPIPPYSVTSSDTCKRWSAAPVIEDQSPPSSTPLKDQCEEVLLYGQNPMYDGYPGERGEGSGEEKLPSSSASSSASSNHSATTTTLTKFTRDANRCSVQILSDNPSMARWAEAADRVIESTGFYGKSEVFRKEPLGGAASSPTHSRDPSLDDASRGDSCTTVVLLNDGSPLGIHVIPSTDRCGLDQGLLVEGIEPDGRVARNGTIQVHDVIIEINNKSLRNVSFHQAQEIFKDAMRDTELRLVVAMKRGGIGPVDKLVQIHEKWSNGGSKVASVASTKKAPSLSSRAQAVILHSNTRKIGKRLTVNLIKGSYGLGFSITTRDNPAGGEAPIYIKNILPRGAAIEDGHLRIGDRLLEVNGVPVTGYSQPEVAGLLRQIQVGGMASLTVSRQEKAIDSQSRGIDGAEELSSAEQCPSPTLPRQLPSEKVPEDSLMFPWKQREILTFEIPVHDSERAGLGVSVKGKTSSGPNGSIDLGIFVKNVIHGGAASRDGRLKMNDQLVNINGLSLLGKSNSEAMKTLRTAMHQEYRLRLLQSANRLSGSDPLSQVMDLPPLETHDSSSSMQQFVGPTPGMITLTVARRVDGSKSGRESVNSLSSRSLSGQNADLSGTSDVSDNTVIFNFKKDNPYERNIDGSADVENFSINPVIQRLTGNNSNPALRNESYYKATHETWNSSQFPQSSEKERVLENTTNGFGSPTINPPPRDTVLIHDEYDTPPPAARRSSAQSTGYSEQPSQASDAYVSQSSLEENAVGGFSRDQFGRRSMSEKRHATLDAKSTDTYQRTKKAKEEREKYRQEMMVEMEANGGDDSQSPPKGVREVPIDVPFDSHSSSNQISKSHESKSAIISSPKLERLKCLAKFTDLKSYTGKSLTLQPSALRRGLNATKNPQMRSLRTSPSKPISDPTIRSDLTSTPKREKNVVSKGLFIPNKTKHKIPKLSATRKAVSRSLERDKKSAKASFGQELSAIIHSWADRNHELLNLRTKKTPLTASDDLTTLTQYNIKFASTTYLPKHDGVQLTGMNRGPKNKDIVGPGLGMRKSSSLESLQTMVQEMTMEEESHRAGSGRVPRGRGCNESFRAAVDRSYDAPLASNNQMETCDDYLQFYVAEEESESSGSGFGRGNSRQSSLSSSVEDRNKKLNKKKQGIFKGLGSMFRFGKHRKSLDNPISNLAEEERMEVEGNSLTRRPRYKDDQTTLQQEQTKTASDHLHLDSNLSNISGVSLLDDDPLAQSRSERMHQLRAEHQRRHAKRNGMYPTDDSEEKYDHVLNKVLVDSDQQADKVNNNSINSETNNPPHNISVSQSSLPPSNHNVSHSSNKSISSKDLKAKHRGSLYGSCIRPLRHSPSPPPSEEDCRRPERHSIHLDFSNSSDSNRMSKELRELIVHKNVPHKPPLPPRNRSMINNNYKAPLPPSNPKPIYLAPPNPRPLQPSQSCLDNVIGPNFTFTFNKPIPKGYFLNNRYSNCKLDEVAQNLANQTQSDLNNSNRDTNANYDNPELSNPYRIPPCYLDSITTQPLSSNSSSGSSTHSVSSATRTSSLPRMGLKGKSAANKWSRSGPSPAPIRPPKGNVLGSLRSTEVLDQSRFWRMEPVPAEPKAEIEHIRSRSYDLYGDNRPGSRGGIVDPNKFSHYVNYEQIQMHLRKNKEQDRLAKLASQQYQDFREKQTRRGYPGDDIDNRNQLITKLEEQFIHESIVASREQREYQSQRCPRENSYQQRPVSNYFEYESVQAMMSHAQDMSTASLPRKHQQHNSSRPAYPSPPPQNNKNSPSKGMTKTSSRLMYPAFAPSAHREGHYAASGFRPASQYNSMHHSSNLVPGSKV